MEGGIYQHVETMYHQAGCRTGQRIYKSGWTVSTCLYGEEACRPGYELGHAGTGMIEGGFDEDLGMSSRCKNTTHCYLHFAHLEGSSRKLQGQSTSSRQIHTFIQVENLISLRVYNNLATLPKNKVQDKFTMLQTYDQFTSWQQVYYKRTKSSRVQDKLIITKSYI